MQKKNKKTFFYSQIILFCYQCENLCYRVRILLSLRKQCHGRDHVPIGQSQSDSQLGENRVGSRIQLRTLN